VHSFQIAPGVANETRVVSLLENQPMELRRMGEAVTISECI
jgi:hypothetical protein